MNAQHSYGNLLPSLFKLDKRKEPGMLAHMKKQLFLNDIAVRKSSLHGYGVFANKKLRKGEKLEECYMVVCRGGDRVLQDYYFDAQGKNAIFTGFGIIYNHADDPNADYKINMRTRIVTFIATRTIQKDEEIFVSYGDKWFKSRGLTPKQVKK